MADRGTQTKARVAGRRVVAAPAQPGQLWHGRAAWVAPLLAIIVHANTLLNSFVFDDIPVVHEDRRLRHVRDWGEIWTRDYWLPPEGLSDPGRDRLYRPLVLQTFALNYLFGGADAAAWQFHLVNVLLFAVVCRLVWWTGFVLLRSETAAAAAAVLFAVHPIHTEAVAGIVGRSEILAALFMLAALLLWERDKRIASSPSALAAAVCFLAGLLSKETAVCLPLMAVVIDWAIRRRTHAPGVAMAAYWRRRAIRAYVPMLAALGVYAVLRRHACGGFINMGTITPLVNPLVDADLAGRMITPFKLLGLHLRLFVWPDRLCADYSLAALMPVRSLADPLTLLGAAACLGAIIVAIRSRATRPEVSLLVAMFFCSYMLVSNGPILIGTIFAERLFFWPSVWLSWLVGWGASRISTYRTGWARRLLPVAGAAAVLALGLQTAVRNLDWRDNGSLFASAYEVNPRSAKVLHGYGLVRLEAGDRAEAARLLERATAVWPGDRDMWYHLALVYRADGRLADALQALTAGRLLRTPTRMMDDLLAATREAIAGRPDLRTQISQARAAVSAAPDDAARLRLGRLLLLSGRAGEAMDHLVAARRAAVTADEAAYPLADALYRVGRFAEAAELLRRRLNRDADDWRARVLLARCLVHMADGRGEADDQARLAVEAAPAEADAHVALAEVLADLRRPAEAIAAYRSAANLLDDDRPRRVIDFQIDRLASPPRRRYNAPVRLQRHTAQEGSFMSNTHTGSFPIGFRCNCKWQSDLDATIAFAKGNGFAAIDLPARDPAEIRRLADSGLRVGSIDLPTPWGELAAPDPASRRAAVQARADYVANAVKAGANIFFACVLPHDPAAPRAEAFKHAVDGYGQLLSAIAPLGARVVLEGWPGGAPYFPTLACTPADCRAFLREVGSAALGLNFDPSHLIRMGIDPVRFLGEFAPRVYHAHGKDTEIIDEDLYEHGNLQRATFARPHGYGAYHWRYTIPGHGRARWGRMLSMLKDAGYQGIISIELEDENFNGTEEGEKRGYLAARDFLVSV